MLCASLSRAERNERSLTNLVESSSVVLIGTVTNIQATARSHDTLYAASISTQQVLKGTVGSNTVVRWAYSPMMEDECNFAGFAGRTRIWFLFRKQTDGSFEMIFSEECQPVELSKEVETILKSHNKVPEDTARKLADPQH